MILACDSQNKVAHEFIPDEIKACRRWLIWTWKFRDGKRTKVPLLAAEPDFAFGWRSASSTDPRTWRRYEDAAFVAAHYDEIAGIGFALGDGFSGVDLDKCRDVAHFWTGRGGMSWSG